MKQPLGPIDAAAHAARVKRLQALRLAAEKAPLLPCPFCGSEAVLTCKVDGNRREPRVYHFVICTSVRCGCSLKWSAEKFAAVKVWNRRLVRLTVINPKAQ
jgi:Lar family restriction alleviation protein